MLYIIICSFFGMWLVGCAIFFGPCLLKKKYQIKESAIGLKRNVAVKYKKKKNTSNLFYFCTLRLYECRYTDFNY